jgi:hypothetical protein
MTRYFITFKIVRNFSLGFTIYSPKYNGWITFDINFMYFSLCFDCKGKVFFGIQNYWKVRDIKLKRQYIYHTLYKIIMLFKL